ncbi:MAG: hypothetical protein ABIH34_05255 [Nanoarchaeota archaeon]
MSKLKRIFTNFRIIILLIAIVISIVSINPTADPKGFIITGVDINSSAAIAGIERPQPNTPPRNRERIIAINNKPLEDLAEYHDYLSQLPPQQTFTIKTTENLYRLTTKPIIKLTVTNETTLQKVNRTTYINATLINGTIIQQPVTREEIIEVPVVIEEILGTEDIGLTLAPAPLSNIKRGLDLQGGSRVLLQPEYKVSAEDLDLILDNLKERLNIFGLTDVVVRDAGDLSGNQYIIVEIAGANEKEIRDLLGQQGKFEARIGNDTVFKGGKDITYVCRSADCSGIDTLNGGCGRIGELTACRFHFAISVTPEAADRQAELTRDLEVLTTGDKEGYLSKQIDLYLDDALVDSLNIGASLRGVPTTDIAISGSGAGGSEAEATTNALIEMKRLQTILVTGSLPVKLEVVKADAISPVLGEEFTGNALLIGALAILSVAVVVFIRYRKWQIAGSIVIAMGAEVFLLLGLASVIGWNLDLAAIAGIIVALGTGVDDQIIITDEIMRGQRASSQASWRERINRAFFVIMAAYFATVMAMLPLWFAGAGLLKGFAITTIFGVTIGVLITRPAFAALVENLLKD